jgi:type II secretory pathway pseudopilin PulG
MAVVTIVGLMSAAVLPAMVEMIASNRQHFAAVEIKTLAQSAQAAAVLRGKFAYALVFEQLGGGGSGTVQLVTGLTGHCNRSTGIPIASLFDIVTPPIGWQSSLDSVQLSDSSFGSHRVFATMELPVNTVQGAMRICYSATGETYAYGGGLPAGGGEQAQAAVMRVRRDYNGREVGVPRQIVFLPGGTARLR